MTQINAASGWFHDHQGINAVKPAHSMSPGDLSSPIDPVIIGLDDGLLVRVLGGDERVEGQDDPVTRSFFYR
jgi:hypothetical protein